MVNEDKIAKRLTEQRGHDPIRFGKGFRHNGFSGAKCFEHIRVLRALAGIQERHLGRGTVTPEDALCAQSFPYGRLVGRQRLERLGGFLRQVGGVGIIDNDTFGRAQIRLCRRGRRWDTARLSGLLD